MGSYNRNLCPHLHSAACCSPSPKRCSSCWELLSSLKRPPMQKGSAKNSVACDKGWKYLSDLLVQTARNSARCYAKITWVQRNSLMLLYWSMCINARRGKARSTAAWEHTAAAFLPCSIFYPLQ